MNRPFRVIALLAIRNEELFLERCLEHLYQNGILTYVIDNESTDNSVKIAQKFLQRGVINIDTIPYTGVFDLTGQLEFKQKLAKTLDADWFIHHDADEIRYAPSPFPTLLDGILHADQKGYNAINFDEFVFVPTSKEQTFEGTDYVQSMRHYYFFAPKPLRRINAWKKTDNELDLVSWGGHAVHFQGMKIFPQNFIMRHYLALSFAHACKKYENTNQYKKSDVQKGWCAARVNFRKEKCILPDINRLKEIDSNVDLDTSNPWKFHTLFGRNNIYNRAIKFFNKLLKFK